MSFPRAAVFALVAALVAPQAFAQDDLFVPIPKSSKSKPKAGKKGSKKPAAAKKPAPAPVDDDLFVPIPSPSKKPATAKKPAPAPVEDDLIVPIPGGKGEVLVKLGGGIKGARLFVDNKDVGALPLSAPLSVDEGEHTLVVRRPGFADFTRRVTAQQDKPTEVAVTLEAVAGVVAVSADVPGASVTINGQPRGQVPLAGLVLKPGSYDILVSKEGFQPETKNLAVKAGKDYTVAVNLRPAEATEPAAVASADRPERPKITPTEPAVTDNPMAPIADEESEVSTGTPWFKRWYVWAGVGVVAAAAVGTVVATQGGAGKPLTPGDVCGGPCDGTINGVVRAGAH
jgi:hypothetical protein